MNFKFIPTLCCAAVLPVAAVFSANQLTNKDNSIVAYAETVDEPSTCALTELTLTLAEVGNSKVAASLKNKFTLFHSVVAVRLCLYSSLTKTTDISKMDLEASAYSADLNMGESLTVESSTHGEDRYWVAYAIYYKNTENKYYQSDTQFYYADGTYNPAL